MNTNAQQQLSFGDQHSFQSEEPDFLTTNLTLSDPAALNFKNILEVQDQSYPPIDVTIKLSQDPVLKKKFSRPRFNSENFEDEIAFNQNQRLHHANENDLLASNYKMLSYFGQQLNKNQKQSNIQQQFQLNDISSCSDTQTSSFNQDHNSVTTINSQFQLNSENPVQQTNVVGNQGQLYGGLQTGSPQRSIQWMGQQVTEHGLIQGSGTGQHGLMTCSKNLLLNGLDTLSEKTVTTQATTNTASTKKNQLNGAMQSYSTVSYKAKYKTEICKNWENGKHCTFGENCAYAHGLEELQKKSHVPSKYKTELCKQFHENSYCPYGQRCQYIHSTNSVVSQTKEQGKAISYQRMLQENIMQMQKRLRQSQNPYIDDFNVVAKEQNQRLSVFDQICGNQQPQNQPQIGFLSTQDQLILTLLTSSSLTPNPSHQPSSFSPPHQNPRQILSGIDQNIRSSYHTKLTTQDKKQPKTKKRQTTKAQQKFSWHPYQQQSVLDTQAPCFTPIIQEQQQDQYQMVATLSDHFKSIQH